MKHGLPRNALKEFVAFSALGRAVWDETITIILAKGWNTILSVLSVEPYGMKHVARQFRFGVRRAFSALGRAVWDETYNNGDIEEVAVSFSALGRAVWDETITGQPAHMAVIDFQCSRSSRMG